MKVVIVHGQSHQGNTYWLTELLVEQLDCSKEDIQTFYVNGISQCVGCFQCVVKDENLCPHRAQIIPILTAMDQAGLLIFTSPTYCYEMTGQLKSFCDHLAYRWMIHRPVDMRNKLGVAVSTAAGGGASSVTKSIQRQMQWWSVGRTYRLPFTVRARSWAEIPEQRMKKLRKKTKALARTLHRKVGRSHPSLKVRMLFQMMRWVNRHSHWNELDQIYWRQLTAKQGKRGK